MTVSAIGVDVGGTTIKVGVAGDTAEVSDQAQLPTPRTVPVLVSTITAEVRRLRAVHGQDLPVGVVVPGIVEEVTGTWLHSANLGLRDVPVAALLQAEIGPCVIGHDVRAGGLAEAHLGVGRQDIMFLPLGTGLAAALVLDGELWANPWTGEIGQIAVPDPDTGSRVPLEQVASASGLARRYARLSPRPPTEPGARPVLDRLRAGDPVAAQVLTEGVSALAEVLAVCCSMLGSVPVVVGGGLAGAGELLLEPLRHQLRDRLTWMPAPEVLPAALGSWAGCRGAALLAQRSEPATWELS